MTLELKRENENEVVAVVGLSISDRILLLLFGGWRAKLNLTLTGV